MTQQLFPGSDPMSLAVNAFDWASTPLGPISDWPSALRTTLGMVLSSRFPMAIAWGRDMTTFYNQAFVPILGGKHPALGRSFPDVWAEAWDEIAPIAERAMAGEATFIEDFPLVINRSGHDEQCHFTFCYSPIRDENGAIAGMIDTVVETTNNMRMQARQETLNRELQHRIKNMLSTIAAISSQTLRNAPSLDEASRALQSRIMALGTAHATVSQSGIGRASIHQVVTGATKPHGADNEQIEIEGPDILLDERQSLALSLAVNELATNAIKHGALSVPDGKISIRWGAQRAEDGELVFRFQWEETDGPPVQPPSRTGFGTTLIGRIVPTDFDGSAEIDYATTGLRYRLITELDKLGSGNANALRSAEDPSAV